MKPRSQPRPPNGSGVPWTKKLGAKLSGMAARPFRTRETMKATRQRLGLLGFADAKMEPPPKDRAQINELREQYRQSALTVRRYQIGLGTAGIMALAAAALCVAPDGEPPLDPDAKNLPEQLRTLFEADNPALSFLITPEAEGTFRFGLGPPTVSRTVAKRGGDRISFEAFLSHPDGAFAKYKMRWRDQSVQEYVGDFKTLREILDKALCDVNATVRRPYSTRTQIVRPMQHIPMRLVPHDDAKHLIPPDFSLQICSGPRKTGKSVGGGKSPEPLSEAEAEQLARQEIETNILANDPFVVDVDVEEAEPSIQFLGRMHERVFEHRYFISMNVLFPFGPQGMDVPLAHFARGETSIQQRKTSFDSRAGWVHAMFREKKAGAFVQYAVQGRSGTLKTNFVKLEFTPRALAWYERWSAQNPDTTDQPDHFPFLHEVSAVNDVLQRTPITIRVFDDMEGDDHNKFRYEVVFPPGLPKLRHIQNVIFGRDLPGDSFSHYSKFVQSNGELVDTQAPSLTRVGPDVFFERFSAGPYALEFKNADGFDDRLGTVKVMIENNLSPKGKAALERSALEHGSRLSLTDVLTRHPIKLAMGITPDGAIEVDTSAMQDHAVFGIPDLQDLHVRYARTTTSPSATVITEATVALWRRNADGIFAITPQKSFGSSGAEFARKIPGLKMDISASFMDPVSKTGYAVWLNSDFCNITFDRKIEEAMKP